MTWISIKTAILQHILSMYLIKILKNDLHCYIQIKMKNLKKKINESKKGEQDHNNEIQVNPPTIWSRIMG